jgi:hypothetical protein
VIRFSAALVAVAIGVLIGGIATSKLLLVYIAIVVSAVALVALATGVVLRREELFGEGQALAGAGPGLPAHAGEGHSEVVPSAQVAAQVAPPPPFAGAAAGYAGASGTSAPALSGTDLFAARPAPAVKGGTAMGRPAGPVPPWETPAASGSWSSSAPDWMPATQAGQAASPVGGARSGASSARQDPPPGGAPGRSVSDWGVSDAGSDAGTQAAAIAPWPWAVPSSSVSSDPVSSEVPAARPDTGSGAPPPSWFGRLGDPSAPKATVPEHTGPEHTGPEETVTPVGAVPGETASRDADDDWPARYSWLHDEADDNQAHETIAVGRASGERESKPPAPVDTASGSAPEGPAPLKPDVPGRSGEDADTGQLAPPTVAAPALTGPPVPPVPDTMADVPRDTAEEPDGDVSALAGLGDPDGLSLDSDSRPVAEKTSEAEAASEVRSAPAADAAAGTGRVAVVRGVPRYHEPDCVLIRFMPEGDLQKLTIPQAREQGCTPCAACQPEG